MIRLDEDHKYWVDGRPVPGFHEILHDLGLGDNPFWTEAGREEGTAFHEWMLFLADGNEPESEPDERIAGAVKGLQRFFAESGYQHEFGEKPQHETFMDYCTTPDLIGQMGGGRVLIECKKGAKMKIHRLQTAAQKLALRSEGVHVWKRFALYLKDGTYKLEEHTDNEDMRRWQALCAAYHAKQHYKG